MSYNLIKKINEQLLREVPHRIFPFQYGTVGSLLASLMIPIYGTKALAMIQKHWKHKDLNVDEESIHEIQQFIDAFQNNALSKLTSNLFEYINQEHLGLLRGFFEEEVWQVDKQLATFMGDQEEFRDAILLFVFSVPVFPISKTMQEVLIHFHVIDADEAYVETQSILNEFYADTLKCQRHYLSWKHLDSLYSEESQNIISKLETLIPFTCDGCGKNLKGLKSPFIGRLEIYPSKNLAFDQDDDYEADYEGELTSLFENVGQKPEKDLNKEVWTEYRLFLCSGCRITFIKRIESGEFI